MRQVLPIAGAIVGGMIGGPAGAQWGYAIGSVIGNAVDPLEVMGNKIGDNPTQTASEGGARAIVYGRGCIRATCLIDRGNRQVKKERDQADKGGGPVTINERVYWTFAIGLGEDLIGGAILRCWEGEKLVYDVTPESVIPEESAEFAQKFRFYDGSETQLPDPALEAIYGIGETPYYRGTAYVVFPNYDLTDYREAIPTFRWEVAKAATGINVATALAVGRNSPASSPYTTWSADGTSWIGSTAGGADYVAALANGRFFAGLGSGSWYSDDGGVTKVAPTNFPPTSAGVLNADYRGGVLLAPGGVSAGGVYRSTDEGVTFTPIQEGEFESSRIAMASNYAVSFNGFTSLVKRSTDLGLSWLNGGAHGLGAAGDGSARTDTEVAFAGVLPAGSKPAVTITGDGVTFTATELSLADDGLPTGLHAHKVGDQWIWVMCTDAGQIIKSEDNWLSYEILPWTFLANAVTHNGQYWLFGGGEGGTGAIAYSDDLSDYTLATQPYGNVVFRIASNPQVSSTVTPETVLLSDIVADQHDRAGQSPAQYNVAELTDELAGVVFEQSLTFAEAINQVIGPYFADPSDYDKAIHYIKRGKAVVRTLTADDLIDEPETSMRENAIEYPKKLHLFFQSPITAYAATKATSTRSSPDVRVIGEASIAVPITFNDVDEPAQISAKLHKTYWQDAEGEIEWHVTDEHIDLVPSDCLGLSYRGLLRRARIVRIEDNPGQRKLVMRSDRQSATTSNVTGIPVDPPTPPRPSIISPTILAIMDIPALTDGGDDLHILAAMTGAGDVWGGAALQRSLDGGANYGTVGSVSLNAIMGVLQNTVAPASPHYTDTTNVIQVQLYTDDELESRSTSAWLSEQGAFALSWDDSGARRWEIIQARDVDDLGGGLFELSHFIRGVLDTGGHEHLPGALFVWLDASLLKVAAQTSWLETDLTHRAVSNGLSPETAIPQTAEYTGQSQTEWPVAFLEVEQDGDDYILTWVERRRFGTDVNPIRSINRDGYVVGYEYGGITNEVVVTTETHTFTLPGASDIDFYVAQLNRLTGRGPTTTVTIP